VLRLLSKTIAHFIAHPRWVFHVELQHNAKQRKSMAASACGGVVCGVHADFMAAKEWGGLMSQVSADSLLESIFGALIVHVRFFGTSLGTSFWTISGAISPGAII
jgi:hypothetical protein